MNGLRQLRDAMGGHQVGWTTTRQPVSNAAKKVRQVSRCSAVQSSVYKDHQFEIDALRSKKPVKTGKSVSDVI